MGGGKRGRGVGERERQRWEGERVGGTSGRGHFSLDMHAPFWPL